MGIQKEKMPSFLLHKTGIPFFYCFDTKMEIPNLKKEKKNFLEFLIFEDKM